MGSRKLERPFTDGPDFEHLRQVIMRETKEGPVPIIEIFADPEIMSEAAGIDFPAERLIELIHLGSDLTPEALKLGAQYLDLHLAFSEVVGYDYATIFLFIPMPNTRFHLQANPQQQGKLRSWQEERQGLVMSREAFEAFPWPTTSQINIIPLHYATPKLPAGRKIMAFITGMFEGAKALMGYEAMALKSIEEPDLVDDILERHTALTVDLVDKAAAHPATGAIFYGEDMGFKTQTMFSPRFFKERVIPRLKRIADAAHRHGKPFLLHSCGQIDALMEDLIEVVGIDAKHSFQDSIEPVEEAYRKYGDRIAILGGVDVDLLARGTEAQVRKRTREILAACDRGGFCIGTGNSVTNYCRIENYYAMLDEARKWNRERRGKIK